jgi:putative endonuclease
MFYTYVLFSESIRKFYIGSTNDLSERINTHNKGLVSFTSRGTPWKTIWYTTFETRADAVRLENKIKKRGARRYLTDIGVRHGY